MPIKCKMIDGKVLRSVERKSRVTQLRIHSRIRIAQLMLNDKSSISLVGLACMEEAGVYKRMNRSHSKINPAGTINAIARSRQVKTV